MTRTILVAIAIATSLSACAAPSIDVEEASAASALQTAEDCLQRHGVDVQGYAQGTSVKTIPAADLGQGRLGIYDPGSDTIYLRDDLSSAQQDFALAHEYMHALLANSGFETGDDAVQHKHVVWAVCPR